MVFKGNREKAVRVGDSQQQGSSGDGLSRRKKRTKFITEISGVITNAQNLAMQLGASTALLERTNEANSLYVPSELVRWLNLTSILDVMPGATQQNDLAVAFLDIRNFTGVSERMRPSEAMTLVNRFAQFVIPLVKSGGGVIEGFLGDAVMILHDDAGLLVRLVCEIVEGAPAALGVNVGGGINFGSVSVCAIGTSGHAGRMELTVISDVVNNASRLESMNKYFGSMVLVSGEALAQMGTGMQTVTRCVGQVIPQGKSVPTTVHEVIVLSSDTTSFLSLKLGNRHLTDQIISLFEHRESDACLASLLQLSAVYQQPGITLPSDDAAKELYRRFDEAVRARSADLLRNIQVIAGFDGLLRAYALKCCEYMKFGIPADFQADPSKPLPLVFSDK